MATYAENKFDSDYYKNNRPTYPDSLYNAIMNYHQAGKGTVVDVGCGTGIATFPLLKYFDTVVGTDPSSKMLEPANKLRQELPARDKQRIRFEIVSAEKLSEKFEDNSIDMITGAESIHWVKHEEFFHESYRILRPGGTLAFWFYVEPIFLDFSEANTIYEKYVYRNDRYMGPCWEQPGKDFLRFFGRDIVIPKEKFADIEKHEYIPLKSEKKTEFQIKKYEYTMRSFRNYLYSWSAYHTWQKRHGKDGKNVADMFVDELKETFGWSEDTEIRVEWGTVYFLARKRAY